MSVRRRVLLGGTVLASLAVGLGIAELALRVSGHAPGTHRAADGPVMMEPDPVLGWQPIPGRWSFGPYSPGADPVRVTILPDRSRDTGAGAADERRQLLLIGCSYTMGWAVSDDETFAWQLERRRPDLRVVNRGVTAYGTFQSLLLLERLLASGDRPAHVMYGYVLTHESRNVADPAWLRALTLHSRHGMVAVPYCTLDDRGALVRHPPRSYPAWAGFLATVTLLQDAWANLRAPGCAASAFPVTTQLMLEMDRLCRAHGIRFSVVVLMRGQGPSWRYGGDLARQGVEVIDDCHLDIGPELSVPGEGHPNAEAHGRWAACLDRVLEPEVPLGPSRPSP